MPPANSPSDTPAPAFSPVSPPASSPYLQQLEAISTPVPDFAATLMSHPENDANDENVRFLRTRRRSSPDSSPSRFRTRRRQLHLLEDDLDSMDSNDQRRLRMSVGINRRIPIVRRHRDNSSSPPNYEGRLQHLQSVYGWAPGSEDDEEDIRDDPSNILQDMWYGRISNREIGRSSTGSRNSRRDGISRNFRPWSGELPQGGGMGPSVRYGESALATAALLQSVRRHPRFSSRTRTLQNYILDRERSGLEPEDRERIPSATATSTATTGGAAARSQRSGATTQDGEPYRNFSSSDVRNLFLENPSINRLKEAIKYLERVRFSNSYEESVSSAVAGGFVQFDYFTRNEDDFLLNTVSISAPAESSWLQPGTVFSGSQHAAYCGSPQMLSHRISNSRTSDPVIVNGSEPSRVSVLTSSGRRYWASSSVNLASSGIGNSKDEQWPVKVTIHHIDYNTMTLSGTMEAYNIPDKTATNQGAHIITFLEGEIIDFNTHTLETKNFKADAEIDSTYWRELQPFKNLTDDEIVKNLVSKRWLTESLVRGWILMRWKERCFVTPSHSRQGLTISGFYYISVRRDNGHIEGMYYDPGSSPYQQLSLDPQLKEKMVFPAYGFR